jgi:hypothetical protein
MIRTAQRRFAPTAIGITRNSDRHQIGIGDRLRRNTHLLMEDFFTAAVAFGLGYCVYRRWQPSASKWVWVAGLCWFGQRALLMLDGRHGAIWEVSGITSVFDSFDIESLTNWGGFTIPFLRGRVKFFV